MQGLCLATQQMLSGCELNEKVNELTVLNNKCPFSQSVFIGLHLNQDSFESEIFVQSLSHITPWTAAHQASLSFTISWSLLKLMSIESVMPSNHLVLCCPLLLLPSVFPSIRVFSNESALHIRWPKYCSFSFSIGPSK